ncbi:MAG: cupredoxin domain-containing protein, partial [Actinomycetota bacterium]|nr:cupredoxin domain-containing protein [Actinomycetota bacterium]
MTAASIAGCGGDENRAAPENEPGASDAPRRTIAISESEFVLEPSDVTIAEPGRYVLKAVNNGRTEHALEIEGQGLEEKTRTLAPGESASLTVEITKRGTYELYCPVADHDDKGMRGTLTLSAVDEGLPP